jgi:transcriptional regulator with XRE-family HTH domain
MKKNRSALGSRLRQVRRGLDLTLRDVSAKTGLSQGYLSNIEAGSPNGCNPSLETIRKLTTIYKLDPSVWFSL